MAVTKLLSVLPMQKGIAMPERQKIWLFSSLIGFWGLIKEKKETLKAIKGKM